MNSGPMDFDLAAFNRRLTSQKVMYTPTKNDNMEKK